MTAPESKAEKYVLRNYNASGSQRYLNIRVGYLVSASDAMKFRSRRAAEKFLSENVEFVGYRAEPLAVALAVGAAP